MPSGMSSGGTSANAASTYASEPAGPTSAASVAAAEQQRHRLGDDRLAGSRLARQHVQARCERERCLADQDEIRDAQLAQHQRPNVSRKRCRNDTPGRSAETCPLVGASADSHALARRERVSLRLSVQDQARVDVDARVLDHDPVAAAEHERSARRASAARRR